MKLAEILTEAVTRQVYWVSPEGELIAAPFGEYHWTAILLDPEKFGIDVAQLNTKMTAYMKEYMDESLRDRTFKTLTTAEKISVAHYSLDGALCELYIARALTVGWLRLYFVTFDTSPKFKLLTSLPTKAITNTIELFCANYKAGEYPQFPLINDMGLEWSPLGDDSRYTLTTVNAVLRGALDDTLMTEAFDSDALRPFYGWLSPAGKLIDTKVADNYHFTYAVTHAEEFGISPSELKAVAAKYYSVFKHSSGNIENPDWDEIRDSSQSDDLMEKIYRRGWARVSFDYTDWSVFVYQLTDATKLQLEMFCRGLISSKYPSVPEICCNSRIDMAVFPLVTPPQEITMEIGKIAKGLLEESMKLKDIALNEEITSMSVSSNAAGNRVRRITEGDTTVVKVQCHPGAWLECDGDMNVCPECLGGYDEDGEQVVEAPLEEGMVEHLAALRKIYKDNEAANYHSENAVLLAKHFGTDAEHTEAKRLLSVRNRWGSTPPEGNQFQSDMSKKYHKLLMNSGHVAEATNNIGSPMTRLKHSDFHYEGTTNETVSSALSDFIHPEMAHMPHKERKDYIMQHLPLSAWNAFGKQADALKEKKLAEAHWSQAVTDEDKHHPKTGLYASGSAEDIAGSETSQQINFYLQRAGSNLSAERRATIKRALAMKEKKS